MALAGDLDAIKSHQIRRGRDPRAAVEDAREILDFYPRGRDCLWITLCQGYLWWTFAKPKVTWLGEGEGHCERTRQCVGGWSNKDIKGKPLRIDSLSTKLTKVANYRRTICGVAAKDYLLRRLNGVVEPLLARSTQAREALLDATTSAIKVLDWADFETLIDVIFARSGWHRASALGGTQKLVDMVIEQPTTDERAAVQVKSAASKKQLLDFIEQCDATGAYDRLFFACHSPRGQLSRPIDRSDVHVWSQHELAQTVLRLGLSDWVIEKIS